MLLESELQLDWALGRFERERERERLVAIVGIRHSETKLLVRCPWARLACEPRGRDRITVGPFKQLEVFRQELRIRHLIARK